MRYRALDSNGDYTFGKGNANYLVNSPACVAQAVRTALLLIQGEWFLDTTAGMPWNTKVLGFHSKDVYDITIKSVISAVQGVTAIVNYSSSLDPTRRALTVSVTINTQFGVTQIQTTFSVLSNG